MIIDELDYTVCLK